MKKAYLPDTATARHEAILTARELLAEAIRLVNPMFRTLL
jgi:hypothetical protein